MRPWVYRRNRIAKSARPDRISDAVRQVVRETGVLRGRAVDSTILADATQDTVTQLVAAIRKVARKVPGAAEQIARVCTGHDYTKPGKRRRWGCWPWSPGRTWSPPRAVTVPMDGGGSPARSLRTDP